MHEPKFRHVGALTFKEPSISAYPASGSAFLISPNLVLTAAHNLYDRNMNALTKEWKFYYRTCGILENPIEIEKYFFPEDFKTTPKKKNTCNDYALLKLKKKVDTKE